MKQMAVDALPEVEAVAAARPRPTRQKHTTAKVIIIRGGLPEVRPSRVDERTVLEGSGITVPRVTVPDGVGSRITD